MKQRALRLETALALALARGLVALAPLRLIVRLFGEVVGPLTSRRAPGADDLRRARGVARRLKATAGRSDRTVTCLARAVAGALLLARRGIPGARIRFGVSKQAGRLTAHAWLLLGDEMLLGGEEAARFTPLADLGRHPA